MKPIGLPLAAVLLLLASSSSSLLLASASSSQHKPPSTEMILMNVTASLADSPQASSLLQIGLNVSVSEEEVLVNQVPVQLSAVTRLHCQALTLDLANGSSEFDSGSLVSAVTRVMVIQNRLYSDYEEAVSLQVFSEVMEVDGQQVQQSDMCEVKILLDPSYQTRARYTSIYPISHSLLSRLPRAEDVLVPAPVQERVDSLDGMVSSPPPAQPEYAAPGRLPEVPLRMAPRQQEEQEEPLDRTEPAQSSYSAVCVWVQQARERVRRFCSESLPLFFLVMWVVVIGVVGSAVIVKILDLFFPTCEHRRSYRLSEVPPLPEEEKHTLLENMEVEPTTRTSE